MTGAYVLYVIPVKTHNPRVTTKHENKSLVGTAPGHKWAATLSDMNQPGMAHAKQSSPVRKKAWSAGSARRVSIGKRESKGLPHLKEQQYDDRNSL